MRYLDHLWQNNFFCIHNQEIHSEKTLGLAVSNVIGQQNPDINIYNRYHIGSLSEETNISVDLYLMDKIHIIIIRPTLDLVFYI